MVDRLQAIVNQERYRGRPEEGREQLQFPTETAQHVTPTPRVALVQLSVTVSRTQMPQPRRLYMTCLLFLACILHGTEGQVLRGWHAAWQGNTISFIDREAVSLRSSLIPFGSTEITSSDLAQVRAVIQNATARWWAVTRRVSSLPFRWPVSSGFGPTAYLTDDSLPADGVDQDFVLQRCSTLCKLYNDLPAMLWSGRVRMPPCTHVEAKAPNCTVGNSFVPGLSDPTLSACFLLTNVNITNGNGTNVFQTEQERACVAVVNPSGDGCNGRMNPSAATMLSVLSGASSLALPIATTTFAVDVDAMSASSNTIRVYGQSLYTSLWSAIMWPGGGPTRDTTLGGYQMSWFVSQLSAYSTEVVFIVPIQTNLVPGLCYCRPQYGMTGPRCVPATPSTMMGCKSQMIAPFTPKVVTLLSSTRTPFEVGDGSWYGDTSAWVNGSIESTCEVGGCAPGRAGSLCEQQRCATDTPLFCGGPLVGTCTTNMVNGCECYDGTNADPRTACTTCLPGFTLRPGHTTVIDSTSCIALPTRCYERGLTDYWTGWEPCSGHGSCIPGPVPASEWKCICFVGWVGIACAEETLNAVYGGIARGRNPTTEQLQTRDSVDSLRSVCTQSELSYLMISNAGSAVDAEVACVSAKGRVATELDILRVNSTVSSASAYSGWVRDPNLRELVVWGDGDGFADKVGVYCVVSRCLPPRSGGKVHYWKVTTVVAHTPSTFTLDTTTSTVLQFIKSADVLVANDDAIRIATVELGCAVSDAGSEARLNSSLVSELALATQLIRNFTFGSNWLTSKGLEHRTRNFRQLVGEWLWESGDAVMITFARASTRSLFVLAPVDSEVGVVPVPVTTSQAGAIAVHSISAILTMCTLPVAPVENIVPTLRSEPIISSSYVVSVQSVLSL